MLKILRTRSSLLKNESIACFVGRIERAIKSVFYKEIQKKCAFCASYHYPLFHGFRRNHLLYKFIFARIAQSRNS